MLRLGVSLPALMQLLGHKDSGRSRRSVVRSTFPVALSVSGVRELPGVRRSNPKNIQSFSERNPEPQVPCYC